MSTQYEALNYDGTERRGNYRFVSYRIDILHILEKKEAAAIIFEILYRWETDVHCKKLLKDIEDRKKAGLPPLTEEEVESAMWTYMSYNDFVRETGGALGYNTVIRTLSYLIERKIIEQRVNHDPRYPDYEYRINKALVRKLLKELPASPTFTPKVPKKKNGSTQMGTEDNDNSTQMGTPAYDSTQMGTGSTQEGIATTQMGTEVYPNGGTSQKDTENSQQRQKESMPSPKTEAPSLSHSSTHSTQTKPPSPIATVTTGNTSFSSEEQRIDGYWQELGFEAEANDTNKAHWAKLSKHVHSLEEMKSLYEYTRARLQLVKDKTVYPGNLVKSVTGWKQEQRPAPDKPKPKPYRDGKAEHERMIQEFNRKQALSAARKA